MFDPLWTLRREVEIYTDCTEPGKPVWHDDRLLVRTMAGYTGYTNSTSVASWSDKKKPTRWKFLKTRARTKLRQAEETFLKAKANESQ